MAQYMEKVREMLCAELDKIAQKGKLANTGDVQLVDWLTHAVKSIDTITAMEEAQYSERYSYDDGYSGARGRGRNARRDSMGRYSRDDGYSREGYSRNDRYSGGEDYSRDGGQSYRSGRYSYADGKEDMIHKMREMMEQAPNDQEREKMRRMIEQMQNS